MIHWDEFSALIARHAKVDSVTTDDDIFRSGLDITSIAFTEFIMDLEEVTGQDIDLDDLDASIETVGQLFARLGGKLPN